MVKKTSNVVAFPKEKTEDIKKRQPKHDVSKLDVSVDKIHARYKRLCKKIEGKNATSNDILRLQYLLKGTQELIPLAQMDYVKSKRGMYAFIALTNQIRELMLEIRQLDNSDRLATHIMDNILTPTFKLVVGHLVADFNTMKEEVNDILPPKEAKVMRRRLDEMLRGQGNLLDEIIRGSQTQLVEYLRGGK